MRIATCRYQDKELVNLSGLAPVRTTRGTPRFRLGYTILGRCHELTPTAEEFRIESEDEFSELYTNRLDALGVEPILFSLLAITTRSERPGVVLLCFDDICKGEWCHRRIAASWLSERLGIEVPELEDDALF